jgi:hypothetical protein
VGSQLGVFEVCASEKSYQSSLLRPEGSETPPVAFGLWCSWDSAGCTLDAAWPSNRTIAHMHGSMLERNIVLDTRLNINIIVI